MFNLIKKDLLLQKKANMIYMLFALFFFVSPSFGAGTFIMVLLMVTYVFLFNTFALEEKSNSGILLNSLPLKRSTIVLSKYVLVYMLAGVVIGLKFLIVTGIQWAGMSSLSSFNDWNVMSVAISLVAITLIYSFNLPLIFKYGYLKSRIISSIMYFVLFFGAMNLGSNEKILSWLEGAFFFMQGKPQWKFVFMALLVILLLLTISITLSISFYKRREIAK